MLGKITNPEANKQYEDEMIQKAEAKSIEKGLSPEKIQPGDVLLMNGKIVTVTENDIKKDQFNQISVFGKSFPNFQRFVF